MSHIISLEASNVKRLKAVRIAPKTSTVCIGGINGAGKSSLLDSIAMGLGGKDYVPKVPVRQGEESAEIVIKLDSGITIKRTFTAAGNTYLKVTSAEGANFPSPQAMLDQLTGKLTFDPLAFLREEDGKQAETLRRLVGLDFSAHDAEYKRLYAERTNVNRRLAEMRGAVAAMPHYADALATEVSSTDILAQIEAGQEHNGQAVNLRRSVELAQAKVSSTMESVQSTKQQIATLEKQLADARLRLAGQEEALVTAKKIRDDAAKEEAQFQPIDLTSLKQDLAGVEQANAKVRANVAYAKAVEEGRAKKAEADKLTARMNAMDQAKATALAAAKFPVAGLSFADDVVTFNGLPLSQASSAEQQRVSVAIGAALNPRLKVMLVRDGSLLDDNSLELLRQQADEMGLQIFIERVGKGGECAVIIEDGEVVGGTDPILPPTPEVPKAAPTGKKRSAKSGPPTAAPVGAANHHSAPDQVPEGAAF